MSRAIARIIAVLAVLHSVGCGGDDTVNPTNPEAGATTAGKDAASDARPSDAAAADAKPSDAAAADAKASDSAE